jgi:hypothetical protein
VELFDQFPIWRMSLIDAPLPRATDAAVAHMDPGGGGVDASVAEASLDETLEGREGHQRVRTSGVEEEMVMANVQGISFNE